MTEQGPLTFGLQVPWFGWPGSPRSDRDTLRQIAEAAEEIGFSSLWVMDHFFQLPMLGDATDPMHEGYTTLGYLAGVTERIKLGTLVTGVTYRHPGVLVKQATSLDVLSNGRAWLGLGAAWFEREHAGLGVNFPPISERFKRLEEALQIVHRMWSDDDTPFVGTFFRLEEPVCSPRPLQQPRPPILIGGLGERKTPRLVARYADAWNAPAGSPDDFRRKFDTLRRMCDEEDRDYDTIRRSRLGRITPDVKLEEDVRAYAEAGVQDFIYNVADVHTLEGIKRAGDVIAAWSSSGVRA